MAANIFVFHYNQVDKLLIKEVLKDGPQAISKFKLDYKMEGHFKITI